MILDSGRAENNGIIPSYSSRVHGARRRDQYILVEGARVRAESAAAEATGVRDPL